MGALAKLRTSRGHGVHSPLAYSFITTVLRHTRGIAYYSYDSLPGRRSRRLLRVACFAGKKQIFMAGHLSDADMKAIMASGATISALSEIPPAGTVALIAAGAGADADLVAGSARQFGLCIVALLDNTVRDAITERMPHAMTFTGDSTQEQYLITSRHMLPADHYSLTFS